MIRPHTGADGSKQNGDVSFLQFHFANGLTDIRPKVTHWFALRESPLFAFAGIWRLWTGERKGEAKEHSLFAFLTTQSNDIVRPIHAKAMPVLLTKPEDWDTWLTGSVVGKDLSITHVWQEMPA